MGEELNMRWVGCAEYGVTQADTHLGYVISTTKHKPRTRHRLCLTSTSTSDGNFPLPLLRWP